jgi:photosystem II stability/assembly factor-like uncharacterized protein
MTVCLSPNGSTVYTLDEPPSQVLVGTIRGIAVLEHAALHAPWRVARWMLEGLHISALLWEPRTGTLFAGVYGAPHGPGGLYRSRDKGHRWERLTAGLACDYVYTLTAAERHGRTVLYAGMQPVHLYESEDGGDTWRELPSIKDVPGHERWTFPAAPHQAHVKSVMMDRHDPSTLYVCIEQGGLFKSTDSGTTWRELDGYVGPGDVFYKDVHRLVAAGNTIFLTSGDGLYCSPDGGEHWERLPGTERLAYPDAFVVSPHDEQIMFVAGGGAAPPIWRQVHRADSTVLRSRDGGRTWTVVGGGVVDCLRANIEALALAAWPGGMTLFAGTTDGDVFATDDEGASWTRVASGLGAVSKAHHHLSLALPT